MLTQEKILEVVNAGRKSECLDGRDYQRLGMFFPADKLKDFGLELKEGAVWEPNPWTPEAVTAQLKDDVEFGIEKATNQRGISSNLMYEVVKMWMWVLEDNLQYHSNYHSYGLPFFEEVKAKYFPEKQ